MMVKKFGDEMLLQYFTAVFSLSQRSSVTTEGEIVKTVF